VTAFGPEQGEKMAFKYKMYNGIPCMVDKTTLEYVPLGAPVHFYDDFLGADGLAAMVVGGAEESGVKWAVIDVGDATQAFVADGANGAVLLNIAATSEAEDAVLCWNDQLGLDVTNGGVFQFRAQLDVLPTTGVAVVAGLAGPHNLDKDTVANHAWFRWQANATGLVETDDTTNDNDDKATGLTTVVDTYNMYRIDFTDLSSVKFYVDDVQVATGTTFDMSNLTAAEKIMQPYFSLDKASGTGVGALKIDCVRFWGPRGA
jgi:hypothetical protein